MLEPKKMIKNLQLARGRDSGGSKHTFVNLLGSNLSITQILSPNLVYVDELSVWLGAMGA
jgi:hypothetical protein